MPTDRRDFLRLTAAATGGLGLGVSPESLVADSFRKPEPPAQRAIRILILGGTGFIGPHQVRYALDRGHTVTLFNRGRTNTHLFPGVERLVGDRNGQLDALAGRSWDVVIDNSRSNPEWVRLAADFLKDSVGLYFYVSSRSAYSDTSVVPMTADAPTYTYESAGVSRDAESLPYGLAKALSERTAQRIFVGRTNIVRPGLIIGPGDETDRFTYWVVRTDRGGDVMAPGDPNDPVQFIDVRDATEFMLHLLEQDIAGTFNVTGPAEVLTFGSMLDVMRDVSASDAQPTWVDQAFMDENDASLPLWRAPSGATEGFNRMNAGRAQAAGLTYRPLNVTVRDTLEWARTEPPQRWSEMRVGLTGEREAELLRAWHDSRV